MACIIKKPTENSKGIVTFTTPERDELVKTNDKIRKKIQSLKNQWVVGLHHNWHDYKFKYDPLFDFSMAGEEDLKEVDGKDIPLVSMDACNFVPSFFKSNNLNTKFWDVLYVARAVKFKKIPEFLQCIRRLYDQGKKYRVLFICPIPPYKKSSRKTVFYEIREVYDRMFSEEEKNLFTLLTIDYRYPFPFDLETLSHFYKSSKIFVHFADSERRCRVASYAWASGIPVVGMSCVGSLLPAELRKRPFFYTVENYDQFEKTITQAIEDFKNGTGGLNEVINYFDLEKSQKRFDKIMEEFFTKNNWQYETNQLFDNDLDIRLGRHHGLSSGSNRIDMNLDVFLDVIGNKDVFEKAMKKIKKGEDLEKKLMLEFQQKNNKLTHKILWRIKKFLTKKAISN